MRTAPPHRVLLVLVVAVVLAALVAPAATAMPAPRPALPDEETLTVTSLRLPGGQSQPSYTEFIVEAYEVPTPYGTIRGDVWRPVVPEGVRVPVILTSTPYSVLYASLAPNRGSRAHDSTGNFFVPRGYARAVFDTVGTYGSDGCTDFGGLGERETGAAVVEFLAAQPWSNGRVGMIGASYDGTTAIAAAVEAPEHLVTVVPQVAIDRWYDYMFNDGVRMTLEDNTTGLIDPPVDSPADYDLLYGVIPPYLQAAEDPQGVAAVLADHATPCDRVEHQQRGYETDPLYDEFWIERDYRALAAQVQASVLLEGAWLDDNVKHWATTRFFQALEEHRAREDAPLTMMTIGQWSHSTSRFDFAADLRHAWFDHFLLGLDTGLEEWPQVISEANNGMVSTHEQWPPAESTVASWELGSADFPLVSADARWTDANVAMVEQVLVGGPCEPACTRYASTPFDQAVRITGSPLVAATLASDSASTHITALLLDVAPDGDRMPIARGLLNTNVRDGLAQHVPVVPGEPYHVTIDLWPLDHVLAAGHALELVLSSTNATWGLSDTTRATTEVEAASLHLPGVFPQVEAEAPDS